ncbi:hypothetical protein [Sphingomonas faeni]|uniref:hypothetical protein n=1 Tax=Sphingomonas faeni TaxID=185950 RepID=UPI0020BF4E19|nr:hypothetical protein [Sphingomonas faeni]MCK8458309.1 hypothetical protein [Sphingomonas faeni]
MKFITVALPPNLPKRWTKIYQGRVSALSGKVTYKLRSNYLRRNASWNLLKPWLSNLSHGKCWYCEAKSPRSPFDVDHFRPKLAVTIDGKSLGPEFGYYWLSYEWWNFRLSCQRCNRPERIDQQTLRGKWNEFPIQFEDSRSAPVDMAVEHEAPRFLDPMVEADCQLLAYGIDGEVKPSGDIGTWEYQRAKYTIDQLGLNDWNVPEDRRKEWQGLAIIVSLFGDHPPNHIKDHVNRYLQDDQEYSCFFRSAIGTHRDKQWIEAIL